MRMHLLKRGFSLVELLIASAILSVMLLGFISVLLGNHQLDRMSKQKAAALNTLRHVAAACQSYVTGNASMRVFYDQYKANTKGYEGVPGEAETLTRLQEMGLKEAVTYGNNRPVKVECFPDETNNIYPNADLNGDGDSADNTAAFETTVAGDDIVILPVRLTIEWRGVRGPERQVMEIIVGVQ